MRCTSGAMRCAAGPQPVEKAYQIKYIYYYTRARFQGVVDEYPEGEIQP